MDLQAFIIKLRELRQELKLTQKEFVKDLSITPATLSAYEKGSTNPSISVIVEIATKYKVSVDWLLGLKDSNSTNSEIINYSDILKPLITLTKSSKMLRIADLVRYLDEDEEWALVFCKDESERAVNDNINNLLHQYLNILSLYTSNTIDDNIFEAVIEKLEKDFNFEIKFIDDDLPF